MYLRNICYSIRIYFKLLTANNKSVNISSQQNKLFLFKHIPIALNRNCLNLLSAAGFRDSEMNTYIDIQTFTHNPKRFKQ